MLKTPARFNMHRLREIENLAFRLDMDKSKLFKLGLNPKITFRPGNPTS